MVSLTLSGLKLNYKPWSENLHLHHFSMTNHQHRAGGAVNQVVSVSTERYEAAAITQLQVVQNQDEGQLEENARRIPFL